MTEETKGKRRVWDPAFWRARLRQVPPDQRYKAVYHTTIDDWQACEKTHRRILAERVMTNDSILEVGCAWGRLLDLMPDGWRGQYFGLDLSPDFIALAREERRNPAWTFACGRAEDVLQTIAAKSYDVGVCVSIKGMLKREGQRGIWDRIATQLKRCCRTVLILEYDADAEPEVLL